MDYITKNTERLIVVDISGMYAKIYDEIYFDNIGKNVYQNIIDTYQSSEKFICIKLTY